jgi:hypothetical protein
VLRAFEVNAHETGGAPVSLQLLKKLTITAGYTAADVAEVFQASLSNVRILSYSPATGTWTPLSTVVDPVNQTLTARVGHLSLFAVGGVGPATQAVPTPVATAEATATPTPTAAPPPAGDIAPSPGLMLVLVFGGILMIAAGGTYFVQSRNVRT